MGEPAGIGPEIALKAWRKLGGHIDGRALRLVGTPSVYAGVAGLAGLRLSDFESALADTGIPATVVAGKPSSADARAVTEAIAWAAKSALNKESAGLVTAPIHKSVLTAAGFGYPGHTEYLEALTGAKRAVMMLASSEPNPPLRVVPVTIHIALKEVFARLTSDVIAETGMITLDALRRDFGCANPRLAVAGLNPHAGEDGTMGSEDAAIIAPAIVKMRERGYGVSGPLSADTLFHDAARKNYDAALCMYHDQALIPIKTLAFWSGVNVTLGLPIVRTSPDHGTALGLAGQGVANEASMIAAIEMAAGIAARRGL